MEENLKQLQNTGKDIIKIAIYGPESTGKTTLAKQLGRWLSCITVTPSVIDHCIKRE